MDTNFDEMPAPIKASASKVVMYEHAFICRMPIEQIYKVVASIDLYIEFVPFCEESIFTSGSSETNGEAKAQLTIGYMGMRITYVSLLKLVPFRIIEVHIRWMIYCDLDQCRGGNTFQKA